MRGESDRSAEIGTLVDQVIRHYVFPDIAEEICRVLRERLDAGAYRALADEDFAAAVTEDLQSVNGDKHLRLRCSVEPVRHQSDAVLDDRDRRLQEAELAGHGSPRWNGLPAMLACWTSGPSSKPRCPVRRRSPP